MTIGRVLARGKDKGSGFAIATGTGASSRVALTAAHVVRGQDASSIQFVTPPGGPSLSSASHPTRTSMWPSCT
jgi:hypothetical protein